MTTSPHIYIVCTVRGANDEYKHKLELYASDLESKGFTVHLPHRDTNQDLEIIGICSENADAIKDADEVHVFYNEKSLGTHFDLGVAFALNKKLVVVENEIDENRKSMSVMINDWQRKTMPLNVY